VFVFFLELFLSFLFMVLVGFLFFCIGCWMVLAFGLLLGVVFIWVLFDGVGFFFYFFFVFYF